LRPIGKHRRAPVRARAAGPNRRAIFRLQMLRPGPNNLPPALQKR
jgi:hypothetical protein